MTAVTLFVWLLPAIYVHALYAIRLTSAQRLGLMAAIPDNDPVRALEKLDALRRHSFDSHLWRLLTLRNPWKIYPPELADEIARLH